MVLFIYNSPPPLRDTATTTPTAAPRAKEPKCSDCLRMVLTNVLARGRIPKAVY